MPHTGQKFVKPFRDTHTLYIMVTLRRNGVSIASLADIYGVDKRGVRYHLSKYQIQPEFPVFSISTILRAAMPEEKRRLMYGHRI